MRLQQKRRVNTSVSAQGAGEQARGTEIQFMYSLEGILGNHSLLDLHLRVGVRKHLFAIVV